MQRIILILCLISDNSGFANIFGPVDACTFHKNPWKRSWEQCAEFKVQRGGNGCRKKRWWGTYRGDNLSMYLPDYFIEVTPHFGKSKFTNSMYGWFLELNLRWGISYWNASSFGLGGNSFRNGGSVPGKSQMYHSRIITIANGSINLVYPWFKSRSGGIPACFSAISEHFPAQWRDNEVDGLYALATNTVAVPLCESPAGAIGDIVLSGLNTVISDIGMSGGPAPARPGGSDAQCSYPSPVALIKTGLANPLSDAYKPLTNPLELCLGTLGTKFPRTGIQNIDDPYSAALTAALKFASLAGDTYMRSDYRVEADDKIQMVYPRPAAGAPSCFRPGRDFRFDSSGFNIGQLTGLINRGSSALADRGREDANNSDSYIFAVWKKRHSCEEPYGREFFKQSYKVNTRIHQTICGS